MSYTNIKHGNISIRYENSTNATTCQARTHFPVWASGIGADDGEPKHPVLDVPVSVAQTPSALAAYIAEAANLVP
jgi:hypothetical protein